LFVFKTKKKTMDREQRCTHLKLMDSALEQPQQDEEEEEE
jgi:hypothetical protein